MEEFGGDLQRHETLSGRRDVGGASDSSNHFVDTRYRDEQTFEHVGAIAGFLKQVPGTAPNDIHPVVDELAQHGFETERLRAVVDQRQHDDADRVLQRGELVELIQDDIGVGVSLHIDHDADAGPIAMVLYVRDADNANLLDGFGNFLNEPDLLLHVGDFSDDDFLSSLLLDNFAASSERDRASPGSETLDNAAPAADDPPGGKIGSGDEFQEFRQSGVRIVQK